MAPNKRRLRFKISQTFVFIVIKKILELGVEYLEMVIHQDLNTPLFQLVPRALMQVLVTPVLFLLQTLLGLLQVFRHLGTCAVLVLRVEVYSIHKIK